MLRGTHTKKISQAHIKTEENTDSADKLCFYKAYKDAKILPCCQKA